ncbi:MAG: methyltransferase family protein [Promethearchaeota archaeon]|jgi:protein-S-isoprenylcysteine O-methyltransferase Ste14
MLITVIFFSIQVLVGSYTLWSYYGTLKKGDGNLTKSQSVLIWFWHIYVLLGVMIIGGVMRPIPINYGMTWQILGVALAVIGCLLGIWGMKEFKSFSQLSGTEANTLVTTGPYKYLRNPQYFGFFLVIFGMAFFLKSVLAFGTSFIVLIYSFICAVIEERRLTRFFGNGYVGYKNKTPRFFFHGRKERTRKVNE